MVSALLGTLRHVPSDGAGRETFDYTILSIAAYSIRQSPRLNIFLLAPHVVTRDRCCSK